MAFAASWSASVAPRQTAKRVLLTGANVGGIGGETALGIVRAVPTLEELYLCARDQNKAAAVADAVRRIAPAKLNVNVVQLDLASLESARECAREVSATLGDEQLDVAVLNAGVMACPLNYTKDGIEYQYGVNHLAHAMLVESLRSSLQRALFVSSTAVGISRGRTSPPLVAEKMRSPNDAEQYRRWAAYGDSKLAMSMFARGLALDGIDAVSLHPGVVNTELQRHIVSEGMYKWMKSDGLLQNAYRSVTNLLGFKTPEEGAKLSIKLATDPDGAYTKGALYISKDNTAGKIIAPLLLNDESCRQVKEDTIKFLEKFVAEAESVGSSLDLKLASTKT